MLPEVEEYLRQAAPVNRNDYYTTLRRTLGELVRMSSRPTAELIAELDAHFEKVRRLEQERYQQVNQAAQLSAAARRSQLQADLDHRRNQLHERDTSDRRTLELNITTARDHLLEDVESRLRQAQKEHDQEIWMADTVIRSTRNGLQAEYDQNRQEISRSRQRPEAVANQAAWLLQQYRRPLSVPAVEVTTLTEAPQPAAYFAQQMQEAESHLEQLSGLSIPRLFVGYWPYLLVGSLCIITVGVAGLATMLQWSWAPSFWISGPVALMGTVLIALIYGRFLRRRGYAQIGALHTPLHQALARARKSLEGWLKQAEVQWKAGEADALQRYQEDLAKARATHEAVQQWAHQKRVTALQHIEETESKHRLELDQRNQREAQELEQHEKRVVQQWEQEVERERRLLHDEHQQRMQQLDFDEQQQRNAIEQYWHSTIQQLNWLADQLGPERRYSIKTVVADAQAHWSYPLETQTQIPLGELSIDESQLTEPVRQWLQHLQAERVTTLPMLMTFPQQASLLVQAGAAERQQAMGLLQAVMLRLLIMLPPGRVRFTIIDPVGLGQNFAGFMHLTDYEEALVGGRIWTDPAQIEQRLLDLTQHIELVIQKYLRNEFDHIVDYNSQAGPLAEPYRFLVLADFPRQFTDEALQRLNSIITSGPRCGVYTLIMHDPLHKSRAALPQEELQRRSLVVRLEQGRTIWHDGPLSNFALQMDPPPAEEVLTRWMHLVGQATRTAYRVEVPFTALTPPEGKWWNESADQQLRVPIGLCGATRWQHLSLGQGMAQHGLIAGKTGSGKSTLLHVLITNLALWYSPQEVEFYLVDFKKGVEFKTYAVRQLPHARVIAIESDREFGLSVLQRLDAELSRRGDLYRKLGVLDLASYRHQSGEILPRSVLIIDEFQVFFAEDDLLAQDAAILLDRLVRQGRAFGIHVLLGSQTLGGTTRLARSTMGQMAVRVALQCSEADSQLILDESNVAARNLTRPGEAIYNDTGGLIDGNSPFQVAWLSDQQRDQQLEKLLSLTRQHLLAPTAPIVFEGHQPADLRQNRQLEQLILRERPIPAAMPLIWLGEAVAIKEPTSLPLRRQAGAHLLIVGQQEETGRNLLASAWAALATQSPAESEFYLLDGNSAPGVEGDNWPSLINGWPHTVHRVAWDQVEEQLTQIIDEVHQRRDRQIDQQPGRFIFIAGLHRYRLLRQRDDDFSFSTTAASTPDQMFAELLREGAAVGIHVLAWVDTLASLERTIDRATIAEFDNRVLLQMSSADSSNLIDSPLANRLGMYRALFFSQEQGLVEKFRPYAWPDPDWLDQLKGRLEQTGTPRKQPAGTTPLDR
ncbi:MAG: hypothetical protein HJJLKODD_00153 [Phycisphaerae bacterium]|nr:hypothetical protein [Phycisphaerae bacterium]